MRHVVHCQRMGAVAVCAARLPRAACALLTRARRRAPPQPLTRLDAFVLLVAVASVFWAFSGGAGVLLRPSWSHAVDVDGHPPPPVVADLDGDGIPEVIVASPDGRLLLLSPATDRSEASTPPGVAVDSPWRALPVRRSASLRSQTGLTAGRRPIALAAGSILPPPDPARATGWRARQHGSAGRG